MIEQDLFTLEKPTDKGSKTQLPTRPASTSEPRSAVSQSSGNDSNVWVTENPRIYKNKKAVSTEESLRRKRQVRAQASKSSANIRKATIKARSERRAQLSQGAASEISQVLDQAQILYSALDHAADHHVDFHTFVQTLHLLNNQAKFLQTSLGETNLAQRAIRTQLSEAAPIHPSLFQATLFISGTYSNTCGLAHSDVNLGVGLVFMRGSSIHAVNHALTTAAESSHWTSMAIALLAGWELQFGDADSYSVHMKAWRNIFNHPPDLDESSVLMLRDFAFESLRDQLNTRAAARPDLGSRFRTAPDIPPGFRVLLPAVRPEARSILTILRDTIVYDIVSDTTCVRIRSLGLVTMAWSPHHSVSFVPNPDFEAAWDQLELNALYHLRAAVMAIVAWHSHLAHSMHNAVTYLDIVAAGHVHAHSCAHLRTHALMDTRYQSLAIWARVVLCSISRVPDQDAEVRRYLVEAGLERWEQMEMLLRTHTLLESFEPQARFFHKILFGD